MEEQSVTGEPIPISLYFPLESTRSIRLLELQNNGEDHTIECKMITGELTDGLFPPYTALSYTWGTMERTCPILINGLHCNITSDLFEAMKAIREMQQSHDDMSGYWWIDMLCINQNDLSERGHQVGMMRDIFQKATLVVAWLGPDYNDSSVAMEDYRGQLRSLRNSDYEWEDDQRYFDLQLNFRRFLSRPYWSRVWIIQELCVAQRILLACGKRTVPWEIFQAEAQGDPERSAHPTLMELRTKLQSSKMSLGSLLTFSAQSLSTDLRDRVFGLLGMATGDSIGGIVPDYTMSPCRVFCCAIRAILHRLLSRHVTAVEETRIGDAIKKCLHNPESKDDSSRAYCDGVECNVWWCCLEVALFDS
ncbi:hypothetical protein V2G26_017151 [Clonostachys chloroleuca]